MAFVPTHAVQITPANTVLATPIRRLYVGVTGNVAVRPWGARTEANTDPVIVYQAVPAGAKLELKIDKVYTSLTTANGLVGEW